MEEEPRNLLSELVENRHVGVHIIDIVGVWRVFLVGPLLRPGHVVVEERILRLGLIVHGIEANHILKEPVQVRVLAGTGCGLEERQEYVVQDLLE